MGSKPIRVHRLKTLAPYWERIQQGTKTFEIRKNDRDFQVGDLLELEYFKEEVEYKKGVFVGGNGIDGEIINYFPIITARVNYIFTGGQYGLEVGYCIMSIELI